MTAATHQGRPCKTCGSKEKYTSSYSCVACSKRRSHTHKRVSPMPAKTIERNKMSSKIWYANKSQAEIRELNRKKKYGLVPASFAELLAKQSGVCLGCLRQLRDDRFTCVDHDHSTGAVRGLLCSNCNTALGLVKDNTETLLRLGVYLEANRDTSI